MSCGVVPNTTNTPFYHHPPKPKQPTSAAKNKPFASPNQGSLRFPTLQYASSFRAKAAVEEGELIVERGGSFYELLGVSEEGSIDEIKKAYKQLARKYHPDVSPPEKAEEYTRRFIDVLEAYETLSDPGLRAIYDRELARGLLHLVFSARRRFDEELEAKSQWRSRWQEQLAGLGRSMYKDSEDNLSWGARMRRQRATSSAE